MAFGQSESNHACQSYEIGRPAGSVPETVDCWRVSLKTNSDGQMRRQAFQPAGHVYLTNVTPTLGTRRLVRRPHSGREQNCPACFSPPAIAQPTSWLVGTKRHYADLIAGRPGDPAAATFAARVRTTAAARRPAACVRKPPIRPLWAAKESLARHHRILLFSDTTKAQ